MLGDGGSPDEILAVASDAEVVLCGSRPKFDAEVLAGLSCRGIVRYGIGVDTIDLHAAAERGIAVARVSDYGTEAVAFHAVTTAMALLPPAARGRRRRCAAGRGAWPGCAPCTCRAPSVAGVVGYGRIGRQAATYLRGLGFSVVAHDEYVDVPAEDGVRSVVARRAARDAATSSRCTRPATRPAGRCSTPTGWAG